LISSRGEIVTAAPISVPQLASTIKTLMENGVRAKDTAEKYYKAAGRHLRTLKEQKPENVAWEKYVKAECGLSQTRADELIRIADGLTTLERTRATAREGMRKLRERNRRWWISRIVLSGARDN